MWFEESVPRPSMSLRQSRRRSQAMPNQFISCAPAACIRNQALWRVTSLKVPEASVASDVLKAAVERATLCRRG